MAIEHLDTLQQEFPELFKNREVQSDWDDDFIIVPIRDPEDDANFGEEPHPGAINEEPILTSEYLEDMEIPSNLVDVPTISSRIVEVLGGGHGGAPAPYVDKTQMPPVDCLAFYLPFHYYFPTYWGIYLLFEGVQWLANKIYRDSMGRVNPKNAIRAARLFLYYHEAFHHKTECFATRLELTHRKPLYKTGFEQFYSKTLGTDNCLEEGLSNANALQHTYDKIRDKQVKQITKDFVLNSPAGYRTGVGLLHDTAFYRCDFAEKNQQVCLPHLPAKNPQVWRTGPHMFNGISSIKSRVNYLIPRNSPIAARLPFRPLLPPAKLVRKLKKMVGLEFVKHGANHDIYKTKSGKTIPIPRHNCDLGAGLVRKIISELDLKISLSEFMQS
jgi:predicted RNA binding protein YcfA (HicA-like mRNA interferase family)